MEEDLVMGDDVTEPDPTGSGPNLCGPDRLPASRNSWASFDSSSIESPTLGATLTPKSSNLSGDPSPCCSSSSPGNDDSDSELPPLDRLTVLDLLNNFALPQQLEKIQRGISAQTDKVRRSREALKSRTQLARERMVDGWRRRMPSAEERLDQYMARMRQRVDKLGDHWNDTKVVGLREKISFVAGVLNVFISGYLIGGYYQYFHLWYTVQLLYFLPVRAVTYHRRGYHYFLVDLCYFVNVLLALSIWVFPHSKRLFLSAYCLTMGNNAVAVVLWRNSLVLHDIQRTLSCFIHIMPCVTLHCLVHLVSPEQQKARFPAVWILKNSAPGSPTAYANLVSMVGWSSLIYAFWQANYFIFITVRRREKIAAGRPTSFTWLRKSYSKTWLGKAVLSLPLPLQEAAFMMIQYIYAVLTMLPCPIWFSNRHASATFLLVIFTWSIYNGSTYYIDVFGKRFQKELEAMKAEVANWQHNSDLVTPDAGPPPSAGAAKSEGDMIITVGASNGAMGERGAPDAPVSQSVSADEANEPDNNRAAMSTSKDEDSHTTRSRKSARA